MKKYLLVFSVCLYYALLIGQPAPIASAQVPTLTQTSVLSTYTPTPTIDPYYGECPIYPDGFDFSSLPFDYIARCSHCFPDDYLTLTPAPTSPFPTVIFPTVIFPTVELDPDILTEYPTSTPESTVMPTATISPTFTPTPIPYAEIYCASGYMTCEQITPYHIRLTTSVQLNAGNTSHVVGNDYDADLYTVVTVHVDAGIFTYNNGVGGFPPKSVTSLGVTDYYLYENQYTVEGSGNAKYWYVPSGEYSYMMVGGEVGGWEVSNEGGGTSAFISANGITVDIYSYPPDEVGTPTPIVTVTPSLGFCSDIPDTWLLPPIVDANPIVDIIVGECIEIIPEISFEIPAVEPIWSGWEVDFEGVTVCPYYVSVSSMRIGDVSIPDGMMAIGLGFLLYKLIF